MLIEFSVTNYRSFRERQTLSLATSPAKELATNTCKTGIANLPALVRTAVIYGPNAAGKTNLLRALLLVQQAVVQSAATAQVGGKLNVQPFAFSSRTASAPSEFEVHFIHDGVRYQFVMATTRSEIVRESLTAYPSGRPQLWYERNVERGKTKWGFGKKLKGTPKLWAESTRPNALFLSTAVQLNSAQLKPVFDWFQEYLICIVPTVGVDLNPYLTYQRILSSEAEKESVMHLLGAADLRMRNVTVKREPVSFDQTKPIRAGQLVTTGPGQLEMFSADSFHASDGKAPVSLPMTEESTGTQRVFNYAGGFLKTLQNGCSLVIDEIETHLHPKIVRFLIEQFHDPAVNKKCAQLLVTTHDTSILTNDLFRRDQIWFVDRTKDENSKLYSLAEFKARKDEPFEKNYLRGRYGALPVVGDLLKDGH